MVKLIDDLYLIPIDKERSIVYSPLRGVCFFANGPATDLLYEYILTGALSHLGRDSPLADRISYLEKMEVNAPTPMALRVNYTDAVIILSQLCNLRCVYCYAEKAHSNSKLNGKTLSVLFKFLFETSSKKTLSFTFIGGGEPLLPWAGFTQSIELLKEISFQAGKDYKVTLSTNGTLLTSERIKYLLDNKISLSISFDILPWIQNTQRPLKTTLGKTSFDLVDKNIKESINQGLTPRIRSTITEPFVSEMPNMVKFVHDSYPTIKRIHLEPVASSNKDNVNFFPKYFLIFFEARKIGNDNSIFVSNSITQSFRRIRSRFCNGELCLTTNGSIVACHRVSVQQDFLFPRMLYGNVTNKVVIDKVKLQETTAFFESKEKDCRQCFAKWHCAGGCPSIMNSMSVLSRNAYCNFVRDTIKYLIVEQASASSIFN